jgi:hypothetical protein
MSPPPPPTRRLGSGPAPRQEKGARPPGAFLEICKLGAAIGPSGLQGEEALRLLGRAKRDSARRILPAAIGAKSWRHAPCGWIRRRRPRHNPGQRNRDILAWNRDNNRPEQGAIVPVSQPCPNPRLGRGAHVRAAWPNLQPTAHQLLLMLVQMLHELVEVFALQGALCDRIPNRLSFFSRDFVIGWPEIKNQVVRV